MPTGYVTVDEANFDDIWRRGPDRPMTAHEKADLLARILGELELGPDDPRRFWIKLFGDWPLKVVAVQWRRPPAWMAVCSAIEDDALRTALYGVAIPRHVAGLLFPALDIEAYAIRANM